MKQLILATVLMALPVLGYQTWTGGGGDGLFSNPLNWAEGAITGDVSNLTILFGDAVPDGAVLTNDLPAGPYQRITVSVGGRAFTLAGNPIGLKQIDNSYAEMPSLQRYDVPIQAYGTPTSFRADPNTTQVFGGLITVMPTNLVPQARVAFCGTGTNVIAGGLYASADCNVDSTYGTDKTVRFDGGTTLIASDVNAPTLYIGNDAHVIVSNGTLYAGSVGPYDFIHTCTIDLMKGGRFVAQNKSLVCLAQGSTDYTSKINVYDGGLLDFGYNLFRPADDGRFELTVNDGGLANWSWVINFSYGGGTIVTLNGGRLLSSQTTSNEHRFRVGYVKRNSGIDFENQLVLNGGELVCAGFWNRGYSGQSADLCANIDFNGGVLVPLYDTTAFNSCDSTTSYDQLRAVVRAGGLVFDTRDRSVVWNDVTLRGNGGFDGGLMKRGTGTLTLTAEGTYTGTNCVEAGTLAINAANASQCLFVAGGAQATVGDPAYFAQALHLGPGAVFGFTGTTQTLTALEADRGIVRLVPAADDAGQRLAISGLSISGVLRFRLVDASDADWAANGTYTLLAQTGLAASVAAQCRVDNPVSGKTYDFAVSGDVLTVTVADGTDDSVLVVTEDRTISDPLAVSGDLAIYIALGQTLTLTGGVTGEAGARIVVTGPGTLAITGGCAVPVTAEDATVSIASAADLAGGVTLASGATLLAMDDIDYAGAVQVDGPAQLVAATGKTFTLSGTLSGPGALASSGSGIVSVADATGVADGIVIGGVTAFDTAPSGEVVFDGGTLLYTGAADATLDATLRFRNCASGDHGLLELADGAGRLDVTGPLVFDSSLSFRLRTAVGNELVLHGSGWSWGDGNFARSICFGRGNFRLAGDCRLYMCGGGQPSLQVGDPLLDSDAAQPTTLAIEAGADVLSYGLLLQPAAVSLKRADVSIVQNGGTVSVKEYDSLWGPKVVQGDLASYVAKGGTFSLADWMNFMHGDSSLDVAGGTVALGSMAFGYRQNTSSGYYDSAKCSSIYENCVRVTEGRLDVKTHFNWMGDVDYSRRRARLEVAGTGTLAIPATERSVSAPEDVAPGSTALALKGGTLQLSGVVADGTSADDYLQGLDDWTIGTNCATIATTGSDATIKQRLHALSSVGGTLVKSGAGTLTLAASNNVVFGGVDVREGTFTAHLDAAAQSGTPDSLVALWTFDGDNPLADKTGHGYDLVQLHGETSPVAFTNGDETIGFAHAGACAYWPKWGGSLGMTNAVAFNWNAHTVSFWTKLRSFDEASGLLSFMSTRSKARGSDSSNRYSSLIDNRWCICLKKNSNGSGIYFDGEPVIYPGVCPEDTTQSFTLDAWHMVTSVRDGTNVWEYIDGRPVRCQELQGTTINAIPAAYDLKRAEAILSIGQTYGGFDLGNEYLNAGAMMDDIAIYSRALSADEVAALYVERTIAPTPAVTVAEGATWNMNGCSIATPRLAGAGTVVNGTLAVTNVIVPAADAATPLYVETPVFPTEDVTVDFGCTEAAPLANGTYTLMIYETLDAASQARVPHWKLTGTGRAKGFGKSFSVDTAAKAIRLQITAGGTVLIFR